MHELKRLANESTKEVLVYEYRGVKFQRVLSDPVFPFQVSMMEMYQIDSDGPLIYKTLERCLANIDFNLDN